jgi:hypothetical protein
VVTSEKGDAMRPNSRLRALAAAPLLLACAGCVYLAEGGELSHETVCGQHYENDPTGLDRCLSRGGSPNDLRPQDLPVDSGAGIGG